MFVCLLNNEKTNLGLLSLLNPRAYKDGNIVLPVLGHNIISRSEELHILDIEASFFLQFAGRALFEGFVEFDMPAGERPCVCFMMLVFFISLYPSFH